MRKLFPACLAFWALAAAASAAPAAPAPKTEVLLKTKPFYPAQGGPGFKVAYLDGQLGLMLGGRGAVMLSESVGLGAGGYSLASEVVTDVGGLKRDVAFAYGGVTIDNFFLTRELLFLNVSMLLGPGFASGSRRDGAGNKDRSLFLVVEPELNLMLNVTRELRVSIGLGYRLTAGADTAPAVGTPVDGFSGTLTLMYGKL